MLGSTASCVTCQSSTASLKGITQQREVTEEVDHWTTVCHCPSDKQL